MASLLKSLIAVPGEVLVLCCKPAEAAAALLVLEKHLWYPSCCSSSAAKATAQREKKPVWLQVKHSPIVQMDVSVCLKQALLVFLGGFAAGRSGDVTVVLRASPATFIPGKILFIFATGHIG